MLPFCRCIAIGIYAADKMRSKAVENWLLQKAHVFVSVIGDSKSDLCKVNCVGKIVSFCF